MIVEYALALGVVTALYCLANLVLGYAVPRLFGVGKRQAVASSFEIGIHNATLATYVAIYVAIEVLGSVQISIPSALYGLIMFIIAACWGAGQLNAGSCRLTRSPPPRPDAIVTSPDRNVVTGRSPPARASPAWAIRSSTVGNWPLSPICPTTWCRCLRHSNAELAILQQDHPTVRVQVPVAPASGSARQC